MKIRDFDKLRSPRLPQRLFHFTHAEYALDDLRNQWLKIARFDDLNDPFEFKSVVLSARGHELAFDRFKSQMAQGSGVLCFSEIETDILQWSHYADRHRGICLGFDVSGSDNNFGRVRYVTKRKTFPDELDPSFGWDLLRTKSRVWKYEREWRVFVQLTEGVRREGFEKEFYFARFGPSLVLRDVLLGAENKNAISEIQDTIQGYDDASAVRIARVYRSARAFKIKVGPNGGKRTQSI